MCDRVLVMRQGKIEAELTPGLITEESGQGCMGEPIIPNGFVGRNATDQGDAQNG